MLRGPDDHDDQQVDDKSADDKSLVNTDDKTDDQKVDDQKTDDKVEDKKDDQKTDDDQKVEPLTAESLTIPEGLELQPELTGKFLEILNGDMAPQDRANALIALQAEAMTQASEASSKAWEDMQTKWKEEAKADPEIGGAKLQPTLTNIGKLLDEFGTKELRGVFDLTGAGNNPHMVKFLNTIATKLTEGGYYKAGSPGGSGDPAAAAKRLFPTATA